MRSRRPAELHADQEKKGATSKWAMKEAPFAVDSRVLRVHDYISGITSLVNRPQTVTAAGAAPRFATQSDASMKQMYGTNKCIPRCDMRRKAFNPSWNSDELKDVFGTSNRNAAWLKTCIVGGKPMEKPKAVETGLRDKVVTPRGVRAEHVYTPGERVDLAEDELHPMMMSLGADARRGGLKSSHCRATGAVEVLEEAAQLVTDKTPSFLARVSSALLHTLLYSYIMSASWAHWMV